MVEKFAKEANGVVCQAAMYHDAIQSMTTFKFHSFSFNIAACAYDKKTKEPVKVKRITLNMGNHPNYFHGGSEDNPLLYREDVSVFDIGPWYWRYVHEDYMSGGAKFHLYDGTVVELPGLRIRKNRSYTIGFDITIPF